MKPGVRALVLSVIGICSTGWAANYSVLHHFSGSTNDGATPQDGLTLLGSALYGTTQGGGSGNGGAVFRLNTDGSNFTILNATNGISSVSGITPFDDMLYGITFYPASVFKIGTNGTDFAVVKSLGFQHAIGMLLLDGDTLYGTVNGDGTFNNYGFVFKVNTNGSDYAVLHTFTASQTDGSRPVGGLVLSGTTLFGVTTRGGHYGQGTVYQLDTGGTGFAVLHDFGSAILEGTTPKPGLLLSGTTLYGATTGRSTIFKVETDGTGFSTLHTFTGTGAGLDPESPLSLSNGTLYGTTYSGGATANGTVFQLNTDGTGFITLHDFNGDDGASPAGSLVLLGSTLYGTTAKGGSAGKGVLFALNTCLLNIQQAGQSVILSWNDPTFSLQAAPNVTGVYTNVPGAASPFDHPITGPQMFFRLRSN